MFISRRPNIFILKVYPKLPVDCKLLPHKYCFIMANSNEKPKAYRRPMPPMRLPTKPDKSAVAQSSCCYNSGSGHNIPTLQNGTTQKESINLKNIGRKRNTETFGVGHKRFFNETNLNPVLPPHNFFQLPHNSQSKNLNYLSRQNYSCMSFIRGSTGSEGDNRIKRDIKNQEEKVGGSTRKWELTPLGKALKQQKGGEKTGQEFTLMSYNVLAQDLLEQHPHLYKEHNSNYLTWEKRWGSLYNEIACHKPDILCLQEVQKTHLKRYYRKAFDKLGYYSIYKKRTGSYTDGCAIFFQSSAFVMHETNKVEFKQPNSHRLDRDNVGIIIKLAPKSDNSQKFIVATTHLLYNPKREDVRIAQIQLFLTEVERMAYQNENEYLPIIICGDFNSEPQSSLVDFISKSYLNYNQSPLKTKVNSNYWIPHNLGVTDSCQHLNLLSKRLENKNLTQKQELNLIDIHHEKKEVATSNDNDDKNFFATGKLKHQFNFKSVYEDSNIEEKDGTTFQDRWICVDYIFYSVKKSDAEKKDDKLKLISRYTLPKCEELTGVHIPNDNLGSDHISLSAKFKMEF